MESSSAPHNPYDETMGHVVAALDEDHCIVTTATGPRFHQPHGITHGGFLAGLMDSSMGYLISANNPGVACSNVDLQISFARATRDGQLTARADVLKRGRRAWVLQSTVTDEDGNFVAQARSTFLILGEA